jgi:hypothetical protein
VDRELPVVDLKDPGLAEGELRHRGRVGLRETVADEPPREVDALRHELLD